MDTNKVNDQISGLAFSIIKSVDKFTHKAEPESAIDLIVFDLIVESQQFNPWFIPKHMVYALKSFAEDLQYLSKSILSGKTKGSNYNFSTGRATKIACLLNPSKPLAGMAEVIYLATKGFLCEIKPEDTYSHVLKKLISLIDAINLPGRISLIETKFSGIDAILAMTSLNDTQKEYFSRYPILELTSKGYSFIISGDEDDEKLSLIANAICMYFGRSDENIKVLFIPKLFEIERLRNALGEFSEQLFHNRYFNNYDYRKSSLLFNKIPFKEISPIIITEDLKQAGYTSILYIQRYDKLEEILNQSITKNYPLINSVNKVTSAVNSGLILSGFKNHLPLMYQFLEKHKLIY